MTDRPLDILDRSGDRPPSVVVGSGAVVDTGTVPLDIYWYFPFGHKAENNLALATLRPGDTLTVQSLATRFGQSVDTPIAAYHVVRDLPEPGPAGAGRLRWGAVRLATHLTRSRRRRRAVERGDFAVVHIHLLSHLTDWRALRRLGVPLVSTVHDVVPHEARLPRFLERGLLRSTYRHAGVLLVAHEVLAQRLSTEFGVDRERIRIVPLPVPTVEGLGEYRTDGPVNVLFFGTFRHNKGIPVLLEAIRSLRRHDVRFQFAGTGEPELESLVAEAAAADERIEADIRFIRKDRLDELYRKASLVVMPYTSFASQSGVLRDAYGYGVPVVVTHVGALGRQVSEDDTGWVVPPGDEASLTAALAEAIDDPEGRAGRASRTRDLAAARSYERVGAAIRAVYDEVAGDS